MHDFPLLKLLTIPKKFLFWFTVFNISKLENFRTNVRVKFPYIMITHLLCIHES